MPINEFNELHSICPADEMLLMRELRIPIHNSDTEIIKDLQETLSGHHRAIKTSERIAARQNKTIEALQSQIAELESRQKVLSQENARLLAMLHNEREAHEQSRLLMEKRITLASVRNDNKKPLTAAQGVKNAYSGSYAERVRAKRF